MTEITLSWPHRSLWPNSRIDRRAATSHRQTQKREAWALTTQAVAKFRRPTRDQFRHINITFHPPDKIRRDLDNMLASIKAGLDGVSDALGVDDSEWTITIKKGDVRKGGAVVVQLCLAFENVPVEGVVSSCQ